MWKENLYQPVEVLVRSRDEFPVAEHQHSFYEMVYVQEGSGLFYVKEAEAKVQETRYEARSLFLIPPNTVHSFIVGTHSTYVFIRFTVHYAADYIGKYVEHALHAANRQAAISLEEPDKETVSATFGFIKAEVEHKSNFSNYLIQQWLNSIIVMVARNLMHASLPGQLSLNETDKPMYMLQYIQQHIHQPEMLKTDALCEVFHLSARYIGHYFKQHFQEDLQHYITRNRIKMVENLLLNTSLSVKEIANQMSYTDSSYLIKQFREYHDVSPLEFRKRNASG